MGGDAPINASGEVSEKTFNLQVDGTEEQHQEVLAHDEPSGVVVFGAFAAGSLIGIIVCAPAFVVFLLGAGVASLTSADSKPGKISRKIGKAASDVIFATVRKGREINSKYKLSDKATEAMRQAADKVRMGAKKPGFTKSIKAKAAQIMKTLDQRTTPRQTIMSQEEQLTMMQPSAVTDGTQLPLGASA